MRNLFFLVCFLAAVSLCAQDAPAYQMYHNVIITAKADKMAEFTAAYGAHNKKYHNAGSSHVNVFTANSGPNLGKFINSMGPMTWADVDARKEDKAHDMDWQKNVMPYIASIEDGGHWRLAPDLSYIAEGTPATKLRLNVIDMAQGENADHNHLMKMLAEAQKATFPSQSRMVFNRVGFRNDGRDRVILIGLNKWADLDEGIADGFEKVHGEGSWARFIEEINEAHDSSYGELWERSGGLSGTPNN
jgi:hypothetical protein